ncbi:GDSL-like Lipase/Acylhydrolase-like protein [Trematosphaeria pertusa]|uniref:GDSL-like Lipase/Acylhydrolase-like protein n=1 Tax=Trematosphaeria pertusa TaxID=390896 RepID=A0A6A6J4D1_9PLEO|nr:GDSL-like Lipase/Acylhydrolase-like protein [Trematosphaeria pertusa]KAF2257227.1 GDSL-like Lipase/Acylhydrolase-like protein [Trematosphaeria pertusa]
MRLLSTLCGLASLVTLSTSTIFQNGQERETHFIDTRVAPITANSTGWKTYGPNATELAYKGRWDSKHVSWWAAPGLKFGFEGQNVAITFGNLTSQGVLVAYRLGGLDWHMSNVTAGATHQFVSPSTPGLNLTQPWQFPLTFELRVTNWAYGVQIAAVHLSTSSKLIKIPPYSKTIEFIGDSLTSGYSATYEAFSGFGYNIGAGFGNVEFSITAYPGICLHDADCWGNPRGQEYQWHRTPDTSPRAYQIWGAADPPKWDFAAHPPADIVIINIGTNDNNTANGAEPPVTRDQYLRSYLDFIPEVHAVYPKAQIVLMSLWNGFSAVGNSFVQTGAYTDEVYAVYKAFESDGYVHYFNSTGILQHNDIGPQWHPTDVGHVKIASHVMQYIRLKFGWEFAATGPEVQHETLYWNDEVRY